jgi:hypothetical protein
MISGMGRKRKNKKGFEVPKKDRSIELPDQLPGQPAQPDVSTSQAKPIIPTKIKRTWNITPPWALLIIAISGTAAFISGLSGPFTDDDGAQIVNNPLVQSLAHIRLLFEGGTFYNGGGLVPLSGIYYRPLMMTIFSVIYTIFGPQPSAFHIFQLILCMATAFLVFLVFRYTFRPLTALLLTLVFLLHPIDSQVVFAIASMQEPLFLFFGMLALWLLLRFSSMRSLLAVAVCLFLSMLAKETGILFIVLSLLYLFWFNRERLRAFIGIITLPAICYLALRIHAVGLLRHNVAPIGSASILTRLLTMPSIILFYITKLIYPVKLSAGYFWLYKTVSFQHVILPMVIDIAVIWALIYGGKVVRRRLPSQYYMTYLFFASWLALGLLVSLQIVSIDMTASETWFYFPMVGLLGMIGLIIMSLHLNAPTCRILAITTMLVIAALGLRTFSRGTQWQSVYSRASHDVAASSEDYVGYTDLATAATTGGNYNEAKTDELRSIAIYPSYNSYDDLGLTYAHLGDYQKAFQAYAKAAKFGQYAQLYQNTGEIMLFFGDPNQNKQFLESSLHLYPHDPTLWMYLAIVEQQAGDNSDAKVAMATAEQYATLPVVIDEGINNNTPFQMYLADMGKTITVE